MKTWYKIAFKLNGSYSFSVFSYENEKEKSEKLANWKREHATPYNNIEILWHQIDSEDFTQRKNYNLTNN